MKKNKGWFKKGMDKRRSGFKKGHPSFITQKTIDSARKRMKENNPMHNKKIKQKYLKSMEEKVWHNPERNRKVSEKLKNRIVSDKTKEKIKLNHKGKHYSPETEFKKGMKKSPKAYKWGKGVKLRLGLTKENDESVLRQSINVSKTLKNQYKNGRISGMLGKENKWGNHTEESKQKIRDKRLNQITPIEDTKIEIKIQEELTKRNIIFETHKVINNINHKYRCDIFIEPNIIVECDGNFWHNYPIGNELDYVRTKEMIDKGFKVLRFWESDIKNNINKVMEDIENAINK